MKRKTQVEPALTSEQQQIIDDGLRILARMIVRRHMKDSAAPEQHGIDGDTQ